MISIDENFLEVGYNYRPLFNEIDGNEYLNHQYYVERPTITTNDITKRIKRKYQTYKTAYFLKGKRSDSDLYQELLTIDQGLLEFNDLSFTFFHWSLIEQLQNGTLKVDDIEPAVLETVLYNILPGGNTVLHKLCESEEQLLRIFAIAHEDESKIKYHVPLIPNLDDKTAVHMCVDKSDYKSIDTILKYLKYYDIDHHSRAIKDLYPVFIEKNLPEFLGYIDLMFK